MSDRRPSTILSITLALAASLASACSNPTPDAFNRPITPSGSPTAGAASDGADPADDPSSDGDPSSPTTSTKAASSAGARACIPPVASRGTGEHHPGESCAQLLLVTGDNGNFYSSSAVQMPLTVRSSKCPSDSAMSAKVSAGSCNSCHTSTNPITL